MKKVEQLPQQRWREHLSPVFGEVGSKALRQSRKLSQGLLVLSCGFAAGAVVLLLQWLCMLRDHPPD